MNNVLPYTSNSLTLMVTDKITDSNYLVNSSKSISKALKNNNSSSSDSSSVDLSKYYTKEEIDRKLSAISNILTKCVNISDSSNSIDLSLGSFYLKTIINDTTFEFKKTPPTEVATFCLLLNNTGNFTVNFPSNVKWSNGIKPDLTSNRSDLLTFVTNDSGVTWYGIVSISDPQ